MTGACGRDADAKGVFGFRATYVFDLAQTDGEPLAETAEASGDPGSRADALRAAIVERYTTVESVDDFGGALGERAIVSSCAQMPNRAKARRSSFPVLRTVRR